MQLTKTVFYDEMPTPMPPEQRLRAGPLTLCLEASDLRYVSWGNQEILRRVYVAVRDRNWGTIAPIYSNLTVEVESDSFHVTFDARHEQGDIDFFWRGEIIGSADGTIVCTLDGVAQKTFWRNRIGFCILIPRTAAGTEAEIEHGDGASEHATFPITIDPAQPVLPFSNMRAITREVEPGVSVRVQMEGDVFEMEDQRNWTDASYKIFGTPLSLPFPVEVREGTRVRQTITLTLRDERPQAAHTLGTDDSNAADAAIVLSISDDAVPLPPIGLGNASHNLLLTAKEVERLRPLRIAHLRADLYLNTADYARTFENAVTNAKALDVPLWLGLFLSDEPDAELAALLEQVARLRPQVAYWLVYPERERYQGGAPLEHLVTRARYWLAAYDSSARFATGSNADYIFFARSALPVNTIDAVSFAINPQLHAFDNLSLVETLEAQADVVSSARALTQNAPVLVSPVTFKARRNFYATSPEIVMPGELPPQVDPRQTSLLGGAWTAISIQHLAEAGATAITYFEATGWRGVMETEAGSAHAKFPSTAGMVFPLYHILADVAEMQGGDLLKTHSSQPLKVQALALRRDKKTSLLVCNLTPQAQTARLSDLNAKTITVRRLNEATVAQATSEPETFRNQSKNSIPVQQGALELTLLPYEVARLDIDHEETT